MDFYFIKIMRDAVMEKFLALEDLDVKEKKVLLRVDFNTPLDKKTNEIADDTRIKESLPTIRHLIKNKAVTIIICHIGRPKGEVVESLSTEQHAERLGNLLKQKVYHQKNCIGKEVKDFINTLKPGDVVLLENLRFHKEEEENDDDFSRSLAELADLYVDDAFGAAHRAHASVFGVTKYLKSAAGFLLEKEIDVMGHALENPERPFVAIMGGLKVSDKIKAIENLLKKVDKLLIGGAMAYTFFAAEGIKTGKSFVEKDAIPLAKRLLESTDKIVLPVDNTIADRFDKDANSKVVDSDKIPEDWEGLDIGPKTVNLFSEILKDAKTIIWNGTLGVAEFPQFAKGSEAVAKAVADVKGTTIIGGGETAAMTKQAGVSGRMSHISTGGGASLQFLEGKPLPAIEALTDNYKNFR